MKVKELIKILQEFNPELDLIISTDDEGNSYRDTIWVTPGHIEDTEYELEFHMYERDEEGEEIWPTVEVAAEKATALCLG